MPHDSTEWLARVLHTNLEGDYAAQAKRAGCWGELRPYEELRAHWEPAKDFEERLVVISALECFLPEVPLEEKCDFASCRRPAEFVWWRTPAEIKKGSTKQFKLGERFKSCALHKVGWRPWVPLGAARAVEAQEPRSQPKPRKMPAETLQAPQGRRKHACPTCRCEVRE